MQPVGREVEGRGAAGIGVRDVPAAGGQGVNILQAHSREEDDGGWWWQSNKAQLMDAQVSSALHGAGV